MIRLFLHNWSSLAIGAVLTFFTWSCTSTETTPAFNSSQQALVDDTILHKYLFADSNDIRAQKTTSGIYYSITSHVDTAALIDTGDFVFLRYEGRLLDSTLFDSNLDKAKAFVFEVGLPSTVRAVIKGLDEGIIHFRKGEKGNLYIPSGLAYGNNYQAKIPANSCLKFSIHVTQVE